MTLKRLYSELSKIIDKESKINPDVLDKPIVLCIAPCSTNIDVLNRSGIVGTARERSSRNNGKNRPVCMFDVDGTFIREFYNIANAAKTIGGKHSCILRCCSNKVFCYKGYIWRYKEDIDTIADAIKQYKSSKSTNRKIKVILNGETKIFNSMSQVAKSFGISRDTLRKYNKIRNISWEII